VDPVDVAVARIVRERGAERESVAEPEDVLEVRCEKDCEELPVEVLEPAPLLLRVGEADDVFDRAEEVVCVFEDVIVRVAVAVDVSVLEGRPVLVAAEVLEDVFEAAAVTVGKLVGRIDFVDVELGDGSQVPASERVDVGVFVDVLDRVEVAVGIWPITSKSRS